MDIQHSNIVNKIEIARRRIFVVYNDSVTLVLLTKLCGHSSYTDSWFIINDKEKAAAKVQEEKV